MLRLTSLLCLFALLVACAPQKLLEKGKPAKAFERAASQAERNSNAKTSTLDALATSYSILQSSDYDQVSRLANSNSPTRWEGMVGQLDRLEARRRRVAAIRRQTKRVVRLDQSIEPAYAQELVVAKREAAAHLLRQSKSLLALAENGDMLAAREAFANLERRDRYAARTAGINNLSQRAVYLGTIRVALDAQGGVSNQDIDRIGLATERALSSQWVEVYPLNERGSADAHLIAELDIATPYVAPLVRDQTRERFERSVEKRKKVGVDTSGNPIFQVMQKELKATVVTKTLYRQSTTSARLTILNAKTGTVIKRREFSGTYVFEDFTTRIRGDREALGDFCPPQLDQPLSIPPSIFAMEDAAIEALRCAVPRINLDRAVDKAAFVAR
ncbi:MAG: hypothetical protein AB8F78_11640 [Saprospiraceae bacterium]